MICINWENSHIKAFRLVQMLFYAKLLNILQTILMALIFIFPYCLEKFDLILDSILFVV